MVLLTVFSCKHSWEPLFCILSIFVDFCVLPPFKTLIPCYKTFTNLLDSMLKLANSSIFLSNCFYPHIFLSNNNFFYLSVFIHESFLSAFFIHCFYPNLKLILVFYPCFYPRKCFYPISVYPHRCCLSRTPTHVINAALSQMRSILSEN